MGSVRTGQHDLNANIQWRARLCAIRSRNDDGVLGGNIDPGTPGRKTRKNMIAMRQEAKGAAPHCEVAVRLPLCVLQEWE